MNGEEIPLLATGQSSSSHYRLRPSVSRSRSMQRLSAIVLIVVGLIATVIVYRGTSPRTALLSPKVTALSKKSSSKPNIIFVLADDVGYNSISLDVAPFMQSLKDDGIVLEQYYSQESCTPARAALLTGRYPLTLGMQFYEQGAATDGGLPTDETTLADVLQDEGYTTYMLGKWNLGNAAASDLPTARGFNYYLGFLDAYNYYWTKRNPDFPDYKDFMYSDNQCYYMYDGADMNQYSTAFFKDAAVASIEGHDFDESPMFMYVALQSARAPFEDTGYSTGITDTYLDTLGNSDARWYISQSIDGDVQKQYFKSVAVMDLAVAYIYFEMDKKQQLDNTYFIFASDNGGCPTAGGRNYPLRGTKGSLFEGGVHVESFIYSEMDSFRSSGTYSNLFHVSDWFPTILDMAGVKYSPKSKYALDGVSHYDAIMNDDSSPRDYMLYNYYYNPSEPDSDLWSGKAFAIRNDRYKLMHTYDSSMAGAWYDDYETMAFDDDLASYDGCAQFMAQKSGAFTYFLFDLQEDPTEKSNLYDSSEKYKTIQEELYSALADSQKNAAASISSVYIDGAETAWAASENYVVPWESTRRRELGAMGGRRLTTVPSNCGLFSSTFMTGKDLEEQQAAMDAEVAATAATTTTTASPGAPINYDPPADTTTSVMESSSSKDTGGYVMTKLLSPFQSLANLMMSVEDNADAPEPEGNGAHLQKIGKMEKIESENNMDVKSHTSKRRIR